MPHLRLRVGAPASVTIIGAVGLSCLLPGAADSGPHNLSPSAVAAYRLLEIVDPEAVPTTFHAPSSHHFCATPVAVAAFEALDGADPLTHRLLARALTRPSLERQFASPSGHFRLHYNTGGRDGVDPSDTDLDGIPDYVELAAALADSSWEIQIEQLGYRPPPGDGDQGGGSEVDIYILDLGRSDRYGIAFPVANTATAGPGYLHIDNDFTDPIYGSFSLCAGYRGVRGLDALRVTMAHEFFHIVQFGYSYHSDWWQEASATWMEDVVHPRLNDYLQYVCQFIDSPGRSLDSGNPNLDFHAYGASIFAHFLDQRYGRDVIRRIWEERGLRRVGGLDAFDRALRDDNTAGDLGVEGREAGIERAFADFSVWSWFVGDRFRAGYFSEGDLYPSYTVPAFTVAAKAAVSDSGGLDHMASRYFRFEPRLLPGGATIRLNLGRGRWRNRLLLVSRDSVHVHELGSDRSLAVIGWDAYDDVVLVLNNVDVVGLGFPYEVTVEYDPQLADDPVPVASSIGPGSPNPFLPGLHEQVRIHFDLARASDVTVLSLFSVDGRLVRRYDLGARAARRHVVAWDGTNEDGLLVGSGLYYAVLETDGVARRSTVAVVRGR